MSSLIYNKCNTFYETCGIHLINYDPPLYYNLFLKNFIQDNYINWNIILKEANIKYKKISELTYILCDSRNNDTFIMITDSINKSEIIDYIQFYKKSIFLVYNKTNIKIYSNNSTYININIYPNNHIINLTYTTSLLELSKIIKTIELEFLN